jgi:hypothetical protein
MGLSTETLAQWEKNEEPQPSVRGWKESYSEPMIALVIDSWKTYCSDRKKVKISAFMKKLRENWQATDWLATLDVYYPTWLVPCPSRKTVEDMLLGNGLRQPKTKKRHSSPAEKIRQYYPNAQVLLDGKEVELLYKNQLYGVNLEFCKDIASTAITGMAVSETENYQAVKKALGEHEGQYGWPLAALTDNRSANLPLAIELGNNGGLLIRARPYRPQSRGPIENEFGLFEKKVSRIEIKGQTDHEIAMSIVDVLARTYLRLRNQTPRCSTCPMTPEKLMHYQPSELERQRAWQALVAERDKRAEQKERALKISAEKIGLIESVVKEHNLAGDQMLLKKSLRHVEVSTIREAERRFYVASERDTFDATKRTTAYFCGIALRVQQERDGQRREKMAQRRYGLDQKSRQARQERILELQLRAEDDQRQKHPEKAIVQSFQTYCATSEDFRQYKGFWLAGLDKAVQAINRRRNIACRNHLVDLSRLNILAQCEKPLELRYEFINILESRMLELGLNVAKSVTPN